MSEPVPAQRSTEKETGRLEAFSDGVLAVIITIMALELHAPLGGDFADLRGHLPGLLIYVLSFANIGIYWNNHHHLLRASTKLSAPVMWANLHLLFWLSLIPVSTEWVGDAYRHTAPAAVYSTVALASGLAYSLLSAAIVKTEGRESAVARAVGRDRKGLLSVIVDAVAIALSFVSPWISYALLVAVAIMWFVPDRRLERV